MISSSSPPMTNRSADFSKRSPNNLCWQMLERLEGYSMELDEFLKHWDVSHDDLTYICGCSLATVQRWFVDGDSHRGPTRVHKQKLALASRLWTKLLNNPRRYKN